MILNSLQIHLSNEAKISHKIVTLRESMSVGDINFFKNVLNNEVIDYK